ncbi:MAG: response regulator [Desulfomonilaceae bacterium]|nr:response regulator [Desulfomonilaceae bacterium]
MARILVIDDDDAIRELFKKMLERAGHQVVDAFNGRDGIRKFVEDPAELVITDIFMPEKEGLETIRELRRVCPEVKILAVSGGIRAMESSVSLGLAKKLGADRTVSKPVTKADLLTAVDDLLNSG